MNKGNVTQLIDTLIPLFDPIVQAVDDADSAGNIFKDLGYLPPAEVTIFHDFSPILNALLDVIHQVDESAENDTDPDYLQLFKDLIDSIQGIINLINDVSSLIQNNFSGSFLTQTNIADKFPRQFLDYLLIKMLERKHPVMHSSLLVVGVIDQTFVTDTPTPFNIPYLKREFRWEKIPDFLSKPLATIQESYAWNTTDFAFFKLISNLHKFGQTVRFHSSITNPSPDTIKAFNGGIDVVTDDNLKMLRVLKIPFVPSLTSAIGGEIYPILNGTKDKVEGIGLGIYFDPAGGLQFRITNTISLGIKYTGTSQLDAGVVIKPNQPLQIITNVFGNGTGGVDLSQFIPEFIYGKEDETTILFDTAFGAKFEFKSWTIRGGVLANSGMFVETDIKGGSLTLGGGEGDGFLQKILPADPIKADFDLTVGFSTRVGLYFKGSSALEIRFPVHIEIGPISLEGLTVGIQLKEGKIPVSLGADIKATLGPIVAVVQNMGVVLNLSFPPDRNGNLGPIQLDIGFKPPNGVGLSIDAGVIKGGGFLYLDFDKGEYFGALELSFQEVIDLKAIGIINTKMPDGSPGFAFLILITAEFTPIQLGYGFTLNGVGGLLALNRSTDIRALQTGVRTGAVNSILFPEDVVANITRIISDLKSIFPIVQGHFIIGPMGEIGWGTPTLITLELGIIIDIPAPQLVIIGILKCILPTEEAAILKLQVNFAGGVDFSKGLIWFDASLFDSSLLVYTLTGDMALRIGWGDSPLFIISVGGFHPAFHEIPPDLTGMSRMSISLLSGDNPRISIKTYFAITSNTLQSGANAELYAEACGFNVYGFLGYDLLVQFNPFQFIADIHAGLALRKGKSEIAGIHIHCVLSGPTPWHARGDASISFFFFSVSVGFDVTWGEDAAALPEETENIFDLVLKALNDGRNWKATLPPNTNTNVSIKKIELPAEEIIIHPFTLLSVSQKIVPLEMEINKFGNKKPSADTFFHLTNGDTEPQYVQEEFALANFIKMSDSEKLSRKSFEQMKSGLQFKASMKIDHGFEIHKEVTYELSYVHRKKALVIKAGIFRILATAFNMMAKGSAVTKNANSVSKKIATNAPAKVNLAKQGYMVVNTSDMELHADHLVADSEAEAYYMQDTLISKNPALKNKIQVISQFEMN